MVHTGGICRDPLAIEVFHFIRLSTTDVMYHRFFFNNRIPRVWNLLVASRTGFVLDNAAPGVNGVRCAPKSTLLKKKGGQSQSL